jgi:hypothetical protein
MKQSANLWWAYSEDDASFSALPASPFLIPAFLLTLIVSGFSYLSGRRRSAEATHGQVVHLQEYKRNQARYEELISKMVYHEESITAAEWAEYRRLKEYISNPNRF